MIAIASDSALPPTFTLDPGLAPERRPPGTPNPRRPGLSDPGEFRELYRSCHRKVMAICRYMLRDEADAKDACQDTFLRAWQFLSEFRGESAVSTWLTRIAYNRCFERIRKQAQRRERTRQWVEESGERGGDAGDSILHRFFLDKAMEDMGERQRFVLGLILEEGLSHKEAADQLNVSRPAISRHLGRIRRKITGDRR